MKTLIEALQIPEVIQGISDLLTEQLTSETKINPQPDDIQLATFTKSLVVNPLDNLELDSGKLFNLGNNFNDAPRVNIAIVSDLSTIAVLPTANAGFTGNTYIDGILWGGNRWNTGASNQIDYSFWNSGTESFDEDRGVNVATNADNWTVAEKAAMVQALDTWAAVADITFVDVGDNNQSATLGFYNLNNSQMPYGALGMFIPPDELGEGIGYFNWQGTGWDYINGNQQGDLGFVTMIHELGHGLGLAHPHDNGGGSSIFPGVTPFDSTDTGDFGLNQGLYTTMSFNDGLTASGGSPGTNDYGYQGTPMAFDIAAIQHLYGANMSYKIGNDTYFLPTVNASGTFYSSIWDAGGIDKISGVGASAGVDINLNDATLNIADGAGAGGYLSAAMGIFGGFTIANGVTIENADGSDFDDYIIGNEFNNSLFGHDGKDTMSGGAGNDTLYGETGQDTLYGGIGNDLIAAGSSNDTVEGNDGIDYILGGAGDDYLFGGTGQDNLNGGLDADLIKGGLGSDTLSGERGEDIFAGNLAELDNDLISDFTEEDSILVENANFSRENLTITKGSGILDIDTDLDGTIDSTITLEGDFTNVEFIVEPVSFEDSSGTLITIDDTLSPKNTIELFRFRNNTFDTGTYVFVGAAERDAILDNPDFNQTFELEGHGNSAFVASTIPGEGLEAFYRLKSLDNPGTFLFVGRGEYDAIFAIGSDQRDKWEQEGFDTDGITDIPEFYLYGVGAGMGTPFNRFQNRENNTFLFAGKEETEAINSNPDFSAVFFDQGGAFEAF